MTYETPDVGDLELLFLECPRLVDVGLGLGFRIAVVVSAVVLQRLLRHVDTVCRHAARESATGTVEGLGRNAHPFRKSME